MPARQNSASSKPSLAAPKENLGASVQKDSSLKNETEQSKETVRTLLEWKSPVRPFKRRETEYFKTWSAALFLASVILLFIKEWLLIAAIWAFYFIMYVFGRFPPDETEHRVTTQGVTTGGRVYLWRELSDFWFTQHYGQTILNIAILPTGRLRFSGKILLLLGNQPEAKVKEILANYLPYLEIPEKNWMDDAVNWLAKKIPLEKS